LANPYVFDRPLTDQDLFRGREALFSRLAADLRAGQRLFILAGKPRIGKTSFVNQLGSRLGERYICQRIEWAGESSVGLAQGSAALLGQIVAGTGQALGREAPEAASSEESAIQALRSLAEGAPPGVHLICFDALRWEKGEPSDESSGKTWERVIVALHKALPRDGPLALLLVLDGALLHGEALSLTQSASSYLELGPLDPEETEELLTIPVRGALTYDYESLMRIHRNVGGEPFFVQLYGHVLFERRSRAGWVGIAEVEHATEWVVELGAPQFAETLERTGPLARVVLCAFAEMIGHHGVGSVDDIVRQLARLQLRMAPEEIRAALGELVRRDILEQLGGETFRFQNALFRSWLKEHHPTRDALRRLNARQARRLHRAEERWVLPPRAKRIDWLGILLWLLAGALAVVILVVWRTRQAESLWTAEPTPPPETASAALGPTEPPPTPEKGVVPGRIAYMFKEDAQARSAIFVMRADGSDPVRLTDGQANDTSPVWSPDGRRIAFVSDRDGNREVYVMNADGSDQMNLTRHASEDWTPTWAPEGDRLAFASFRDGNWEIYVMNADGSNQTRLTRNDAADYSPSWSSDGERTAFVSNRDGNWEVYLMAPDGSNQVRFTDDPATDQDPTWSPDGTRLLWASYREGNMEIYVARLDGSGLENLSRDALADDHGPTWSPWGRRIAFFSNRDSGWDIYTLDLETGERTNLTMSKGLEQRPHWGP